MIKSLNVYEKLKIFVENLTKLHLKYVKEKSIQNKIIIKNTVVSEENLKDICNHLKEKYEKKCKDNEFREKLEVIIKGVEDSLSLLPEGDSKFLVYDFVQKLFKKTSELAKPFNFHEILDMYFLQLNKVVPTLTLKFTTHFQIVKYFFTLYE